MQFLYNLYKDKKGIYFQECTQQHILQMYWMTALEASIILNKMPLSAT